jgi:hypothetical protein
MRAGQRAAHVYESPRLVRRGRSARDASAVRTTKTTSATSGHGRSTSAPCMIPATRAAARAATPKPRLVPRLPRAKMSQFRAPTRTTRTTARNHCTGFHYPLLGWRSARCCSSTKTSPPLRGCAQRLGESERAVSGHPTPTRPVSLSSSTTTRRRLDRPSSGMTPSSGSPPSSLCTATSQPCSAARRVASLTGKPNSVRASIRSLSRIGQYMGALGIGSTTTSVWPPQPSPAITVTTHASRSDSEPVRSKRMARRYSNLATRWATWPAGRMMRLPRAKVDGAEWRFARTIMANQEPSNRVSPRHAFRRSRHLAD